MSKVNRITQRSTTMGSIVHRSTMCMSIGQLAVAFQQLCLHRVYLTLSVIKRNEIDVYWYGNWREKANKREYRKHREDTQIEGKQKKSQRNDEFERFSTLYHRIILLDAISGLWGKFRVELPLAPPPIQSPCHPLHISPMSPIYLHLGNV